MDLQKKAKLRKDLENQMQAKIFKRERERLYIDDKSLVTSKAILSKIGGVTGEKHEEEQTDMKKIEGYEKYVDDEVKHLQRIAQNM